MPYCTEMFDQQGFPKISGSAGEITAERKFKVALTNNLWSSALANFLADYPLGAAHPLIENLRVISHNVALWNKDFALGFLHYSTITNNDIEFSGDIGATTEETTDDWEGNPIGDIPGTDPPEPIVATVHNPSLTVSYARTEFYNDTVAGGYYRLGVRYPFGTGANARPAWGEAAVGDADSQMMRVYALAGKTNANTFLGQSTGTWLFLGAADQEQTDALDGTLQWRVVYRFAYAPWRAQGWKFVNPYTGEPVEVIDRGPFADLDLVWRRTGEALGS